MLGAPGALLLALMQESTRENVRMDVVVNSSVQNAKCSTPRRIVGYAPYVNHLQQEGRVCVRLKWHTGFKNGQQKDSSQCTAVGTDATLLPIQSNVVLIALISFLNRSPRCY
jgi:hypothetical protein